MHPDLDSSYHSTAHHVDEASVSCGLVSLPDGGSAALEPLCLSRFSGMAERPNLVEHRPAVDRTAQPFNPGYWTADWMKEGNLDPKNYFKRRENQQLRDRSGRFRAVLDSNVGK